MNYVLDACAMIAYLRDEPGAEVVEHILQSPTDVCLAHWHVSGKVLTSDHHEFEAIERRGICSIQFIR